MFAVIKTGGKQYRVAADDVLKVARVKGERGEIVQFGEVMLLSAELQLPHPGLLDRGFWRSQLRELTALLGAAA